MPRSRACPPKRLPAISRAPGRRRRRAGAGRHQRRFTQWADEFLLGASPGELPSPVEEWDAVGVGSNSWSRSKLPRTSQPPVPRLRRVPTKCTQQTRRGLDAQLRLTVNLSALSKVLSSDVPGRGREGRGAFCRLRSWDLTKPTTGRLTRARAECYGRLLRPHRFTAALRSPLINFILLRYSRHSPPLSSAADSSGKMESGAAFTSWLKQQGNSTSVPANGRYGRPQRGSSRLTHAAEPCVTARQRGRGVSAAGRGSLTRPGPPLCFPFLFVHANDSLTTRFPAASQIRPDKARLLQPLRQEQHLRARWRLWAEEAARCNCQSTAPAPGWASRWRMFVLQREKEEPAERNASAIQSTESSAFLFLGSVSTKEATQKNPPGW